ncbi:MAG: glycosyltransferase family 2 protein [Pseudomonadota bacterium]
MGAKKVVSKTGLPDNSNLESFDLTVVMPALNEEIPIRLAMTNTLDAFDEFGIRGEIIVVNDGSTDKTRSVVEKEMGHNPLIRLVNHETPMGVGYSFWDGFDHAKGEAICMMPGDNENDPGELFRYFHLLEHVDMVIPFVFNKYIRSRIRNALSSTYLFVINRSFAMNLNYTNGTVLYRSAILKDLPCRTHGFFFQTDILIRLLKKGYLFAEVPYRLNERREGVSKAVSFRSLSQVAKGYFRLLTDVYGGSGTSDSDFAPNSLTRDRKKA